MLVCIFYIVFTQNEHMIGKCGVRNACYQLIKGKIFSARSNSFAACFLHVKGKLTIFDIILKLNLKFTPIIRTPRIPINKLISHGYGVNRMGIMPRIKLLG